jgi:hypothetical protein
LNLQSEIQGRINGSMISKWKRELLFLTYEQNPCDVVNSIHPGEEHGRENS